MRTNILIKIYETDDNIIGSTIWPERVFIENHSYRSKTKQGLIDSARKGLTEIMTKYGTDYITHCSSDDNFVRCPENKVVLPIDSLYCKQDNELCFYGGGIFKNNKQDFIDKCRIEDRKEGIWNAIETEKYVGFHHVPGRYLCPSCEKKNYETKNYERRINFNYHYPWEQCQIGQFLNSKDIELRKALIKLKINSNVFYASFCAECSIEILGQIGISEVFETIETNVYR